MSSRKARFKAHFNAQGAAPDHALQNWTLPDGTPLRLRAMAAGDAAALGVLFGSLDATARRRRFHCALNATNPAFLARMTQIDPGRCTLSALMHEAARRGCLALRGHVMADNAPMRALLAELDFCADADEDGPCFQAALVPPRRRVEPVPELRWVEALGLLVGLRHLWAPRAVA